MNLNNFFEKAQREKKTIGQFNFCTIDQLHGIALAAKDHNCPAICGTSTGEADFLGMEEAAVLVSAVKKKTNTDLFLNFDHGKSLDVLKKAIDLGYDMVHFDGSDLPFEENVKITKKIVSYAKKHNVLVEGEIARIGGASTIHEGEAKEADLTSLEKVVKFIRTTGVHAIALDIGNVHGVYAKMPYLHHKRISDLLALTNCFVVLHGGSGIDEEGIQNAKERGAVKVNINTELRLSWRKAIDEFLNDNPKEIVPYKILLSAQEAVRRRVEEKIRIFNN